MSWYIVTTPRHQERMVCESLDKSPFHRHFGWGEKDHFETFLPTRREKVTDFRTGQIRVVESPVVPGVVFVRASKSQLQPWVEENGVGSHFYTDINDQPIVVPEYQIRLFKDYLSFVESEVMVLRKPYSYFLQKKKIRILSGRFAGLEGRLFQIKGNYKLVYGLGNTALALSDIAKYPYVEVTDDEPTQVSYTFYYQKMKTDLDGLLAEGMDDKQLLVCLERWRQEASILTQENPVASSYVSLALQQSLADLHAKRRTLFDDQVAFRKIKSIYQDAEDYLSLSGIQIDDPVVQTQIQQRRSRIESRRFYRDDPLQLKQESGPSTDHIFVREQEAKLTLAISLLSESQGMESEGKSTESQVLQHRRQAFRTLKSLFEKIADKLEQRSYRERLDVTLDYRLRKLLGTAARYYRRCKEGQNTAFVSKTQETLSDLIKRPTYSTGGYFDLLSAIRRSPRSL